MVVVYEEVEARLAAAVKEFLERGEVRSCLELLSALEVLRKRRSIHVATVLDERLAKVIESGTCPDLGGSEEKEG